VEGKAEGKITLGRPRHRWKDNIKTEFEEGGCGVKDWMKLAEDRGR